MSFKRSRTDFEAEKGSSQHQPPFVVYGTPLPPLDSQARDDGSYLPLWKQEVRDERGRKRLHGAFTGGYSAGYFNTVGSKEGWTPSTFVSSRSERHKGGATAAQSKPEDFMDEEDVADMQETQRVETQSVFAGLGSTQDTSAKRGFISKLFNSREDTMGIKLLQRMGWREGQGLGPKIKRRARDDGEGTIDSEHLFAPDDVPMLAFNRKIDKFGLGWSGERRLGTSIGSRSTGKGDDKDEDSEDSQDDTFLRVQKPKKAASKPKKSGFGVGILNDNGSDDDDPYAMGPRYPTTK